MTWRRLFLKPAWAVITVAIALTGWNLSQQTGPLRVNTQAAAPLADKGGEQVSADGMVVTYPGWMVRVSAEARGRLVRLDAQEGGSVKQGDLIAEIYCDDLRASIQEAEAKLAGAVAEKGYRAEELARCNRLREQKAVSDAELTSAQHQAAAAEARETAAHACIDSLKAQLKKYEIRAPLSGTVLTRSVHPGEMVDVGCELISLADLSRLRIQAEVDEYDIGRVSLGSEVVITAEGHADKSWRGRVEEVPAQVSSRQLKPHDPSLPVDVRVLLVKVALLEPIPFKIGQRVQVQIGRPTEASVSCGD
jgi:RND family efflux transporter MFP subunit